ncbi:MAG: hypothetical protein F6K30_12690 [Cyanothece sp. SIO2G6]|nr:hypothetical protein [Cyanothece sp. SIO2G6]
MCGMWVGAIAGPIFEQIWKAEGAVVADIKNPYGKVDATNRLLEASYRYEQRYGDRPILDFSGIVCLPARQHVSLS